MKIEKRIKLAANKAKINKNKAEKTNSKTKQKTRKETRNEKRIDDQGTRRPEDEETRQRDDQGPDQTTRERDDQGTTYSRNLPEYAAKDHGKYSQNSMSQTSRIGLGDQGEKYATGVSKKYPCKF